MTKIINRLVYHFYSFIPILMALTMMPCQRAVAFCQQCYIDTINITTYASKCGFQIQYYNSSSNAITGYSKSYYLKKQISESIALTNTWDIYGHAWVGSLNYTSTCISDPISCVQTMTNATGTCAYDASTPFNYSYSGSGSADVNGWILQQSNYNSDGSLGSVDITNSANYCEYDNCYSIQNLDFNQALDLTPGGGNGGGLIGPNLPNVYFGMFDSYEECLSVWDDNLTNNLYSETTADENSTLNSGGWFYFYWTSGQKKVHISINNEYTDSMLLAKLTSQLGSFSTNWNPGMSPAVATIDQSHTYGLLTASQFRFKLPPKTKTNETYVVYWSIYSFGQYDTQYGTTNGVLTPIVQSPVYIKGTGNPTNYVFGPVMNLCPTNFYDGTTNGGTVTMWAEVTDVKIIKPSTPGTGPRINNFMGIGGGCSSCGNSSGFGSAIKYGQFFAEFSLGAEFFGQPVGEFSILSSQGSPNMASPAGLTFSGDGSGVSTILDGSGNLRQVFAPQVLADIVTINPYTYSINFYYPSNVSGLVDGLYQTNGTPYVSWQVQALDTNSFTSLQITETRGGASWQYNYNYSTNNNSWQYTSPGSLSQEQVTTTANENGSYTITNIVSQTYGQPALMTSQTYQTFTWGVGEVSETIGSGSAARTTTKTYYNNGTYPANGSFVPLQQVVNPDGSWQYYNYVGLSNGTFDVSTVYSGQGDSQAVSGSPTGTAGYNYTAYSYTPVDASDSGAIEPHTPRSIFTWANDNYSQEYVILSPGKRIEIQCADYSLSDPNNLVTTTTYFTNGPNLYRVQSIANPNGTMSLYNYAQSTNGWQTNVVCAGQPNGTGTAIVDGTQTTTIIDPYGQTVSVTAQDIASTATLQNDVYGNFDALDRAQVVTHLDGTSNQFNYACCYLEDTIDRDGLLTYYLYDGAKRQYGYSKYYNPTNPITWQNTLDAAGRVVQAQRIGTDGSVVTLNQSVYDTAGRLIAQTNALGGVTTYVETTNALGALVRTTTNPDGGTRIETYYVDGSLKSVTGTGVHGVAYSYWANNDANGISCSYTAQTNLDGYGNLTSESVETFADPSGRTTETLYPDGHYSYLYYNNLSQITNSIDADGDLTAYAYNGKGELSLTMVDPNGVNRITQTTNDVIFDHGMYVRRTQNFVWLDGQTTGTPVSSTETSADGLNTWQIQYRDTSTTITNHIQTVPGVSRTTTSTAPDGSYTVNVYSYGRLTSSTRYDANGIQIGGTTYGYDAHGRQNAITDARNGTTTLGYNNADLVATNTTPNPGSGSPEVTTTLYDTSLRPSSVIQPDGTTVSSVYLLTGELGQQSGSRTYPVGYSYDYAGRMQTMTNWSAGTPEVTTWKYDGQRGWLTNKAYADGHGPSYQYTAAGRLQSRVWVRGVTTGYGYDAAGNLTNVFYSDSTPGVTNSFDRLGRLKTVVANGIMDTMGYNQANQLLSESFTGGNLAGLVVSNSFDADLRRTNVSALAGSGLLVTANYNYDAASRLASVTDGNNNLANYSYLANSPLVSQIVFKQGSTTRMTTTKQYDYLNRLTQISSTPSASYSSPSTFNYNYNPANQRTHNTLADGSYWVYGYDSLGQVTNACKYFSDGTPVAGQQFDYAFDTIGNRLQTLAGGDATGANLRLVNYTNNILNQIIGRDVPGAVDVLGASILTNTVSVNGQTAYRKGEYFRQQISVNNTGTALWTNVTVSGGQTVNGNTYVAKQPEQFSYDADGNLTNDGRWAYTWDGENRLIQMTVNTNVGPQYLLKFAYDSKGRRIQKVATTNGVPISTNSFLYDGWNLIAEVSPNNSAIRSYVWGSDLSGSPQGAGGVGGLLEVSYYGSATTNCFLAFDGNGNVAALINAGNGTVVANYDYGAFGEPIRLTGAMAKNNPFRYSTKYDDDESDLLYYGYRYYKASTGTWPNKDPFGEPGFEVLRNGKANVASGGANLYLFVNNNPLSQIDRLGLSCSCGPDVTSTLARTLLNVERQWELSDPTTQKATCDNLQTWDIGALIGANFSSPCGASGSCGHTVTVNGVCYLGSEVNYVLFGKMCALCNKSQAWMDSATIYHKTWQKFWTTGYDHQLLGALAWAYAGYVGWPNSEVLYSDKGSCSPCSHALPDLMFKWHAGTIAWDKP